MQLFHFALYLLQNLFSVLLFLEMERKCFHIKKCKLSPFPYLTCLFYSFQRKRLLSKHFSYHCSCFTRHKPENAIVIVFDQCSDQLVLYSAFLCSQGKNCFGIVVTKVSGPLLLIFFSTSHCNTSKYPVKSSSDVIRLMLSGQYYDV